MKRALLVSILAAMGTFSMACTSAPDQLANEDKPRNDRSNDDDESDTETRSEFDSDLTPSPTTPTVETPEEAAANKVCGGMNKNPLECAACCAMKHNPITQCYCGPGAKCATACGPSICGEGEPVTLIPGLPGLPPLPSLECVQCVLTTTCDIGLPAGGGDLKAQLDEVFNGELAQCLKGCGK